MKKSSENFDLNIEQSTNLLRICLGEEGRSADRPEQKDRAAVLYDLLGSKLPINPALLESLPPVLRALSEELQSVSGVSLGNHLQDSQTKVVGLRRIKDFAKQLGNSAKDKVERDVALSVYFAAIAAALVYHDVRISQYGYEQLARNFQTLGQHDWIPPDLAELYKKAHTYCRHKCKQTPG